MPNIHFADVPNVLLPAPKEVTTVLTLVLIFITRVCTSKEDAI